MNGVLMHGMACRTAGEPRTPLACTVCPCPFPLFTLRPMCPFALVQEGESEEESEEGSEEEDTEEEWSDGGENMDNETLQALLEAQRVPGSTDEGTAAGVAPMLLLVYELRLLVPSLC